MRCEHLLTPVGVDVPAPRLTWMLPDGVSSQTSFNVIVGTDSSMVAANRGDMWMSGKILSRSTIAEYGGRTLEPYTRYFWKIISWDENSNVHESQVTWFESGLKGGWKGCWISDGHDREYKPAPYFRKEFKLSGNVVSARAYIAAGGLYELYINGKRIGDHFLDPMYTRFDRRNLYVSYDVTEELVDGNNAVGVILGNGWYNHQSGAVWDFDNAPWRNRPAFCIDIRITFDDGTEETVISDLDWKTSSGPLLRNSIYTSEHFNTMMEQDGWNKPGFDDSSWSGVRYRSAPSGNVMSQQCVPIRKVGEYEAVSVKKLSETSYLYDFGRNMAGITRLTIKGEKGTVIRLKHAERLSPDGHADLSNIDVYFRPKDDGDEFQTDVITLSGGNDEFSPKFNYKGFRYVELIADRPVVAGKENLRAYSVHSDVDTVGSINSSSKLINGLAAAVSNAYLSNLMGYPTDCPQREKNGWTGDGHFAIETALYGFDALTVYEKWLADHRDEQQPNGVLPDIIPTGGWGYGTANGLDWTSTIAIIPWNLYLFYGDIRPLHDCYDNIKRYVDYVERSSSGYLTSWGRGDWVPVKSVSSLELTSSVYFYADARILSEAAGLLGYEDDHIRYSILAENIKKAINDKFLDRNTGLYASGTQTELSVPLYWGVVPDDMRAVVAANLAGKVIESDYHIDCGVLGAKALLDALSRNGYCETAYRVALQDTYPSWGWWIVNGATTLLENWDLDAVRDISDNHMMFGEIGAWLYKGIGGIRPDADIPGFGNIILTPYFPDDLEYFSASHKGPSGTIVSSWTRKGKKVKYEVTVPSNSTAVLLLSARKAESYDCYVKEITASELEAAAKSLKYPDADRNAANIKYWKAELSTGRYEFEVCH